MIIEIVPSLNCCIECTAKKLYWKLVDEFILSKIDDPSLKKRIELLKEFLETADIGNLRSVTEKSLMDGRQPIVLLKKEDDAENIEIEVICNINKKINRLR